MRSVNRLGLSSSGRSRGAETKRDVPSYVDASDKREEEWSSLMLSDEMGFVTADGDGELAEEATDSRSGSMSTPRLPNTSTPASATQFIFNSHSNGAHGNRNGLLFPEMVVFGDINPNNENNMLVMGRRLAEMADAFYVDEFLWARGQQRREREMRRYGHAVLKILGTLLGLFNCFVLF